MTTLTPFASDLSTGHRPLHIVIAPSGFKESLSADAVARATAAGVRRVFPDARIRTLPLVDGGEGTAEALAAATGGHLVPVVVTGPVGEPVPSHFAVLGDGKTAVVEMAAAAGLRLVPFERRNPLRTTTRGVGELISAALDAGIRRIVVGCGDSGTSDGGAGALRALGARLLDADGAPVAEGARGLRRLDRIDVSGLDPRLAETEIRVACNPTNVLCGPRGVARVFGPQKGATPRQVEKLSRALDRWARVLTRDVPTAAGIDLRGGVGTGASGGLGAGLAAIGAHLIPRFEVLLDGIDFGSSAADAAGVDGAGVDGAAMTGADRGGVDLDAALAAADLVITAEGSIDAQTPHGKVPSEVARRAKLSGTPVLALAGTIGAGSEQALGSGIDAIHCILPAPLTLAEACERGEELVADGTERALRMLLLGASLTSVARAA